MSLTCAATGAPEPTIMWRRENGKSWLVENDIEVYNYEGSLLDIPSISRYHSGPYLCIAVNGVPPSKSKRIMVIVSCKFSVILLYSFLKY